MSLFCDPQILWLVPRSQLVFKVMERSGLIALCYNKRRCAVVSQLHPTLRPRSRLGVKVSQRLAAGAAGPRRLAEFSRR